ncbi:MAG: hypothetical protein ACYCYK_14515, partial [Candidatus Dormibacteria bacterium]
SAHRQPTAVYNEHGTPKCRRCGGESDFVRFAVTRGKGRLWFRCRLPQSQKCQGEQSIFCDEAPRHLLPVWRIEPAYAAMRVSHQSYEHKHRDLRSQYLLAPDCLALRPKRPGMAWQQLRASAAMLIEWPRVFQRAGWGDKPAVVGPARETAGGNMVERLLQLRSDRRAAPPSGRRRVPIHQPSWCRPPPELDHPPDGRSSTQLQIARPLNRARLGCLRAHF